MSDVRVEVVRTPRGQYKLKVIGDDGPPIRVARNASGIKMTAAERAADRQAIQFALKAMYDRQQAAAAAS